MALLISESEKNVRLRSLPMTTAGSSQPSPHFSTLALSLCFARARWDNCRFVVLRQIRISTIDRGLVEAGFCDASLDIVTHNDRRDAAKEGKGARMRADPIGQPSASTWLLRMYMDEAPSTATNSCAVITSPVRPSMTVSVVPA